MKKLLLGFGWLLAADAVHAQTNFQPGYILPLAGDTLRGEVDLRGAQRNARLCRFRTSEKTPVIEYQPQQLRGYGFEGDRLYQTEIVALGDSVLRETLLATVADTLPRVSFLEVVVQGPATLLYLRDERSNDHYYLRMQGNPVQELIQTTRLVVEDRVTYKRKSNDFRHVLAAATQSCLALQPAIATVRYDANGLIRIVRRYNDCVGAATVAPASETRKNHVQLCLIIGGEKSQLVLNNDYIKATAQGTSAIQPVVGLGLTLRMAGVSKTISARFEALYEKQSYKPVTPSLNTATGLRYEYQSALESIRLPLLVRYTYPRGVVRPFLYAGY